MKSLLAWTEAGQLVFAAVDLTAKLEEMQSDVIVALGFAAFFGITMVDVVRRLLAPETSEGA